MDEDLELNRFVKSALEAKAPFACDPPATPCERGVPAAPHARTLRIRWPWAAASLLAASVALVVALNLPGRGEPATVEDAIRLLSEAEGVELAPGEADSSTALLLAWQGG